MEYKLILPENYKKPPLPGRNVWLEELRSGRRKQGIKLLRKREDGINYECCLGVYCDLQGRLEEHNGGFGDFNEVEKVFCQTGFPDTNPIYSYLQSEGEFPTGVVVLLNHINEDYLSNCNDHGLNFEQIAEIIEQVWEDGGDIIR